MYYLGVSCANKEFNIAGFHLTRNFMTAILAIRRMPSDGKKKPNPEESEPTRLCCLLNATCLVEKYKLHSLWFERTDGQGDSYIPPKLCLRGAYIDVLLGCKLC